MARSVAYGGNATQSRLDEQTDYRLKEFDVGSFRKPTALMSCNSIESLLNSFADDWGSGGNLERALDRAKSRVARTEKWALASSQDPNVVSHIRLEWDPPATSQGPNITSRPRDEPSSSVGVPPEGWPAPPPPPPHLAPPPPDPVSFLNQERASRHSRDTTCCSNVPQSIIINQHFGPKGRTATSTQIKRTNAATNVSPSSYSGPISHGMPQTGGNIPIHASHDAEQLRWTQATDLPSQGPAHPGLSNTAMSTLGSYPLPTPPRRESSDPNMDWAWITERLNKIEEAINFSRQSDARNVGHESTSDGSTRQQKPRVRFSDDTSGAGSCAPQMTQPGYQTPMSQGPMSAW